MIVLMLAALFVLFPFILNHSPSVKPPKAFEGFLDLSSWSFEEHGIVSLEGTWEFYFNQLLTHEDFKQGVDALPVFVTIPSTKKSMAEVKPFPENTFYGTMRLVIKLPEQAKPYALRSDIILTAYQLYINGVFQGEVGKVGTDKDSSIPYYNVLATYFKPDGNEVEIIIHTSDFSARDNSIAVPKIGLSSQISREAQSALGRDMFLFGMLLIMGLYHFGLYAMRSKDRTPVFFGLFCILFSVRMLLVGERFLPSHINLGFFVYGRMAYLCVFIGFAALCAFLYYTMDGLLGKWFIQVSTALGAVFGFLILWFPYHRADILLMIYAILGILLLGYAIICLIIGTLKGYPYADLVLLGFVFLGSMFMNDLIYQITLSNTPSLIPLGVAVFTITQAYTLSAGFSNACTTAEQLFEENASITSELKQMNSNLEYLVNERTSELQKALEEMDAMSKTDYLTKLPNRRMALLKINELIEQNKSFYIALADIDLYKEINDVFGHVKGDEILIRISEILNAAVQDTGFVSRWGGEEFLLVLEADNFNGISEKANKIRLAIEKTWHQDIGKNITITMGLCQYRKNLSPDTIISNADKALYKGKTAGRNQCVFCNLT